MLIQAGVDFMKKSYIIKSNVFQENEKPLCGEIFSSGSPLSFSHNRIFVH
jgi:hypothetical protein